MVCVRGVTKSECRHACSMFFVFVLNKRKGNKGQRYQRWPRERNGNEELSNLTVLLMLKIIYSYILLSLVICCVLCFPFAVECHKCNVRITVYGNVFN